MRRMRRCQAVLLVGITLVLALGGAADGGPTLSVSGSLENLQFRSGWESKSVEGGDSNPAEPQARPALQLPLGAIQFSPSEWLRRVDLGTQVGDGPPRFYLETVQPLYQDREQAYTFFTQPRITLKDGHGTYNLGFGYRRLLAEDQLLGGINGFYDYTDNHHHHRAGAGLELLSRYIELRVNGYFPVTSSRRIGNDANQDFFERPLKGGDIEAGGPVPYLPFLKLYGSYAFYDYTMVTDTHTRKFRAELKPLRFFRVDVETWKEGGNTWNYRIGLVLTLDLERPEESLAKPSVEAYPYKDMRHMMLHRVVREHEIKVEQFAKNKTTEVTVAIGRGS